MEPEQKKKKEEKKERKNNVKKQGEQDREQKRGNKKEKKKKSMWNPRRKKWQYEAQDKQKMCMRRLAKYLGTLKGIWLRKWGSNANPPAGKVATVSDTSPENQNRGKTKEPSGSKKQITQKTGDTQRDVE